MARREGVEVRTLLVQAEAFMRGAHENQRSELYFLSAFCAQQAAELVLKAAWLKSKREPAPWIHDTTRLGLNLKAPRTLHESLERLASSYTTSRYGDSGEAPVEVYTKDHAAQLIEDAEEVIAWAKSTYQLEFANSSRN